MRKQRDFVQRNSLAPESFYISKRKRMRKSTFKKAYAFLKEPQNCSHKFCKPLKTKDNTLPLQLPSSALKHQHKGSGIYFPDVSLWFGRVKAASLRGEIKRHLIKSLQLNYLRIEARSLLLAMKIEYLLNIVIHAHL